MNICGCLLHVAPRHAREVETQIAGTEGCEIHAKSEEGRFVVVVEDTKDKLASETIMELHHIRGVVSLTLTFHHFENLPSAPDDAETQNGALVNDRI